MPEPITKTMYRRKDGQPIADMYGWVDDLEFFYDEYDPIDLVKEVWVLQSSEDIKYPPPCEHIYDEEGECRECGAELEAVATVSQTVEPTEDNDQRWCCGGDWRGTVWKHSLLCAYRDDPNRVRLPSSDKAEHD